MHLSSVSARSSCLAIAVLLTLSSCASWTKGGSGLTPRSEAVCDSEPPEQIPPQPRTEPEHGAWVRELIGLYEQQVDRWLWETSCRGKVRAENSEAHRRATR